MTEDEKIDFILDILTRGNDVREWPKDERNLYRTWKASSFTEAHYVVNRLRAEKILKAVEG